MKYITHSHRFAKEILESRSDLKNRYDQIIEAIESITDEDLIKDFCLQKEIHAARGSTFKSVTPSINKLLKERILKNPGWVAEVDIFNDDQGIIGNTEWRLDFACDDAFCIEVAFNHGEAIAWNLLKPVLACEENHVKKAIKGQLGIYICATDAMKKAGNIDSASGSYEKVLRYLMPMMNQLTIPIMIIGLDEFETFRIDKKTRDVVKKD